MCPELFDIHEAPFLRCFMSFCRVFNQVALANMNCIMLNTREDVVLLHVAGQVSIQILEQSIVVEEIL